MSSLPQTSTLRASSEVIHQCTELFSPSNYQGFETRVGVLGNR
jgi:hypothetical protein